MVRAILAVLCAGVSAGAALCSAPRGALGAEGLAGAAPASAPAGASATRPAGASGGAASSRPGGRWTCWSGHWDIGPRAATPKALWFAGFTGGHIWRYDMAAGRIEVFSALDGLPVDHNPLERLVAGPDERAAFLINGGSGVLRIFIWYPDRGWRAGPQAPEKGYFLDIAFDHDGNLLTLFVKENSCVVLRLEGRQWREMCVVPESRVLVPLAEGVAALGFKDVNSTTVYYVPAGQSQPTITLPAQVSVLGQFNYFRSGDRTLGLPAITFGTLGAHQHGYELGTTGFRECFTGQYIGPDLKAGGFVGCRLIESANDGVAVEPNVPGSPRIKLPYGAESLFCPFRDARGNLWDGRRRWDGQAWKEFTSGFDLPLSVYTTGGGGDKRVRLSADGNSWALMDANVPRPRFGGYVPAEGLAWRATSESGKGELILTRQSEAGREVLRRVPYDKYMGKPQFRTPDGDWWWVAYGRGEKPRVRRLTDEGIRDYPGAGYSLYLTPRGQLWWENIPGGRCPDDNQYARYDPASDSFVADKPWQECAFTLGPLKLSYLPSDNASHLWRETGSGWAPFRTPFSRQGVWVVAGCTHGDRILMTLGEIGVLEYDAARDRWARLTESWNRARFDRLGRRVLYGRSLLVYDGDPFADAAPAEADRIEAEFARLLKRMDDDQWKVRDEATRELANNMAKFGRLVVAAADDASLSAEVRARLQSILPPAGTQFFPQPPPDLLRTMHPLAPGESR